MDDTELDALVFDLEHAHPEDIDYRLCAKAITALRNDLTEWKAAATAHHANPTDFRYWEGRYRDEKARVLKLEEALRSVRTALIDHGLPSEGPTISTIDAALAAIQTAPDCHQPDLVTAAKALASWCLHNLPRTDALDQLLHGLDGAITGALSVKPVAAVPETSAGISKAAIAIADQIVPAFRAGDKSYGCGSHTAKRWAAAHDGASAALSAIARLSDG